MYPPSCPELSAAGQDPRPKLAVSYIVSNFPKTSESFIVNEIETLLKLGHHVEIYSMKAPLQGEVVHSQELVERVHYPSIGVAKVAFALGHWVRRSPRGLLRIAVNAIACVRFGPNRFAGVVYSALWAMYAATELDGRTDRLHAHWATYPTTAAMYVHWLLGMPFSFTAHAHDIFVRPFDLPQKVRSASFVATISEYNRRHILSNIGERYDDKIHVIRCGVRVPEQAASARVALGAPARILCTGTLEEKKGQRYLVEAVSLLSRAGLPVELELVGDGPDRKPLEELVRRLGISDRVRFCGWQPRESVERHLLMADVFALPSIIAGDGRMEGIPVALMEAMAAGVPVVTSSISGIPELVEDGVSGLFAKQRSASSIASAIASLLEDSALRQRLAEAGTRRVRTEFELVANVGRLGQLLGTGR